MRIKKLVFTSFLSLLLTFSGLFCTNAAVVSVEDAVKRLALIIPENDSENNFRDDFISQRREVFRGAVIWLRRGEFTYRVGKEQKRSARSFSEIKYVALLAIIRQIDSMCGGNDKYALRFEESSIISCAEDDLELIINLSSISDAYARLGDHS